MKKSKPIPPYNVIIWNVNQDNLEFYDIMPYLVNCWKEEKSRKHKFWNLTCVEEIDKNIDDTRMPETFEEFKKFVDGKSFYRFWARCEYEVIVTGWPIQKREHKLDVYEQIKANLDVITTHFMNYIINK